MYVTGPGCIALWVKLTVSSQVCSFVKHTIDSSEEMKLNLTLPKTLHTRIEECNLWWKEERIYIDSLRSLHTNCKGISFIRVQFASTAYIWNKETQLFYRNISKHNWTLQPLNFQLEIEQHETANSARTRKIPLQTNQATRFACGVSVRKLE